MKIKNRKLQTYIRISAAAALVAAIIMNLQISFKNLVGEAEASVKVASMSSSGPKQKKGPRKAIDCVYTDGSGWSISVTGVSKSNGTKKAGKEYICEKKDESECYTRECGPAI